MSTARDDLKFEEMYQDDHNMIQMNGPMSSARDDIRFEEAYQNDLV